MPPAAVFTTSQGVVLKAIQYLGLFLYGGCAHYIITNHFLTVIKCQQKSMYPSINRTSADDRVIVKIVSSNHLSLNKNDVIVLKHPNRPNQLVCKRIKLTSGDKLSADYHHKFSRSVVPRGHVWVEGDNSEFSCDSRTFGPVPLGLVMGKIIFRVWPLSQIGWIK